MIALNQNEFQSLKQRQTNSFCANSSLIKLPEINSPLYQNINLKTGGTVKTNNFTDGIIGANS